MDVTGIALSALRASGTALQVQANNVANQLTPGYKAKRVELQAEASGGVRVSGLAEDPTPAGPGYSNVDPANEAVSGMGFEFLYKANLQVLRTQQELDRETLNLKA